MSFYLHRNKSWLPIYIGRRNSTYIIRNGYKQYMTIADEEESKKCLNPICDGNCPMCLPYHTPCEEQEKTIAEQQQEAKNMPKFHNRYIHQPLSTYYDTILVYQDEEKSKVMAVGLLNSYESEIVLFHHPKKLFPFNLSSTVSFPHVLECPLRVDTLQQLAKQGNTGYAQERYRVSPSKPPPKNQVDGLELGNVEPKEGDKKVEHDWQRLRKRITDILKNNILEIKQDSDEVRYPFGTFSYSAILNYLHLENLTISGNPFILTTRTI